MEEKEESKETIENFEEKRENFQEKRAEIRLQEEQIKGEEVELDVSEENIKIEKDFIRQEKEGIENETIPLVNRTHKNSRKKVHSKNLLDRLKQKTILFLKNPYNLAFLVVLLAAFLIRLKYIGQESIWNDAAVHLWFAIKVTKEPLFLFSRDYLLGDHVIPQTITAFFYLFTKNAFVAGKIMAIFYGVVGVIFMYLLGSEIKDKFAGIIGATLLGFNHLFWFYGVRPLADAPLTVMVVLILYGVIKLEKTKKKIFGLLTGLIFIFALLTKQSGVLFLLAFLIYLIIFKRKEAIKNKAILLSWLIPTGLIILASILFRNNFVYNNVVGRFFSLAGLKDGSILNVFNHFQWIFSLYLLIPILLGIILISIYKKKEYYFPIVLFFFVSIYIEIGVRTVEDRIVLPILSIGILLAVFSLIEISQYVGIFIKKKYVGIILVLFFTIFVCWQFYNIGDSLIDSKSTSYAGHIEAGQWLKKNVPMGVPIFVGSPRMQRVFIEREYGGPPNSQGDKGGSLWFLRDYRYLDNKTAFEKDLATLSEKSDVYLEIDVWEYTQPKWYFPINQDSLNYFDSLGFKLVKVVEREVNTQQSKKKMPVIFLFKKEKLTSSD